MSGALIPPVQDFRLPSLRLLSCIRTYLSDLCGCVMLHDARSRQTHEVSSRLHITDSPLLYSSHFRWARCNAGLFHAALALAIVLYEGQRLSHALQSSVAAMVTACVQKQLQEPLSARSADASSVLQLATPGQLSNFSSVQFAHAFPVEASMEYSASSIINVHCRKQVKSALTSETLERMHRSAAFSCSADGKGCRHCMQEQCAWQQCCVHPVGELCFLSNDETCLQALMRMKRCHRRTLRTCQLMQHGRE